MDPAREMQKCNRGEYTFCYCRGVLSLKKLSDATRVRIVILSDPRLRHRSVSGYKVHRTSGIRPLSVALS